MGTRAIEVIMETYFFLQNIGPKIIFFLGENFIFIFLYLDNLVEDIGKVARSQTSGCKRKMHKK